MALSISHSLTPKKRFKFAVDKFDIYKGDINAMKAAGKNPNERIRITLTRSRIERHASPLFQAEFQSKCISFLIQLQIHPTTRFHS